MGELPLCKSYDCPGVILPITSENYGSKDKRKDSFIEWPLKAQFPPDQLVRVGFVYTGKGTLVQCFCCGAQYQDWHKGDNPLSVHQKCNLQCSFLKTLTCERKPPKQLQQRSSSKQPQQKSSSLLELHADDYGQCSGQTMYNYDGVSNFNLHSSRGGSANNSPGDFLPLTLYQYETTRLNSFVGWPLKEVVNPVQLAGVGFVYSGKGTLVQCFQCGIKYRNWSKLGQEITPFDIHYKYNPRCPFLRTLKFHQHPKKNTFKQMRSIPGCETKVCTELPKQIVSNMPIEAEREKLSSKIYPTTCQQQPPQSVAAMPLHPLPGHPYLAAFPDDIPPYNMPRQDHERPEQENRGSINPFSSDTHEDILMDPPQQIPEENRPPVFSHNHVEKLLHDDLKPRTIYYSDAQMDIELKNSSVVPCSVSSSSNDNTYTGVQARQHQCRGGDDPMMCTICNDGTKEFVFYPCGHVTCQQCAIQIEESRVVCPFCRGTWWFTLKAHIQARQRGGDDPLMCTICNNGTKEFVFYPCGDVTCQQCAIRIEESREVCPFCRGTLRFTFRAHIF